MKTIIIITFFGLITCSASGQALEKYIETGLENNFQLRQQQQEVQISLAQLRQSRGLFFPDVDFSSSYTKAAGGRTIDFPVGDLLNPVYRSLNDLTGANFPTNIENVNEQLIPDNFHDTRLQVSQPLINTDIYFSYKAQKSAVSVAEAERDAYKRELIKEIKQAYYRYAQSVEAIRILESNRSVLEEIKRLNESLVENGKATEDAVYRAQFQLDDLESNLADARSRRVAARSHFNFLLNRDLQENIIVEETEEEPELSPAVMSVDEAIDAALEEREEIDAIQAGSEVQQQLLNLEKASYLPKLSAGVSAGYQGEAFRFSGEEDYQLLQVNFTFPIFSGMRRNHKIEEAKIAYQQIQTRYEEVRQHIRFQVIQAYEDLISAYQNLTARESKLRSAEKTFGIIEKKYREGQVLLIDYLDAQTTYFNSRQEVSIAIYQLKQKQAEFERALSI